MKILSRNDGPTIINLVEEWWLAKFFFWQEFNMTTKERWFGNGPFGHVSFFMVGRRLHLYHDCFEIRMENGFLIGKVDEAKLVRGGTLLGATCWWCPLENPARLTDWLRGSSSELFWSPLGNTDDPRPPPMVKIRKALSRRILESIT
ncbi:MAG: hypothetical protein V1716_00300 [Candidatus Uhrbacteria bacterium]